MKKWKNSIIIVVFCLFFAAYFFGRKIDAISVSGGVTTESQILGNMVSELIKHETNYPVQFYNNLGSAVIDQKAMQKGDLDISATRYTGTDLVNTLNYKIKEDHSQDKKIVKAEFKKRFNFDWSEGYGFSNQFTLLMRKDFAQRNQIKRISDLKKLPHSLDIGMDQTWYKRSGDGYDDFLKKYGLKFKKSYPMQVGLLYSALKNRDLDVIVGYSTDPRIKSYDLVLIEDDLHFFPEYSASMVVNNQLYKKYPKLRQLLKRLNNKISDKQMLELNYLSDEKQIEPQKVAKKFLERNSYFEK